MVAHPVEDQLARHPSSPHPTPYVPQIVPCDVHSHWSILSGWCPYMGWAFYGGHGPLNGVIQPVLGL